MDATVCALGLVAIAGILALVVRYGAGRLKHARITSIPGPERSHAELGNLPDMAKAGSLHQFLMSLHRKYGDIVSFWWGKQMTVSVSSPGLFKQQSKLFNRPVELFELFRPFITEDSIQYANGPEGQARHAAYSRCFSETAMANYYPVIQQTTLEMVQKLEKLPDDEHVPLREYMFDFAIKTVLLGVFGQSFKDDERVLSLRRSYEYVWGELEHQLCGGVLVEGSDKMVKFQRECDNIHNMMKTVMMQAKDNPSSDPSKNNFLDVISHLDLSMGEKSADMVTVFVASFHTTGLLLTWCMYYLARHPDIQHRAAGEAMKVAGEDDISPNSINELVYIRQVIDETMRCSVLGPYAARYSEDDVSLDGHHVPGGTSVIHALGVSLHDPERWPQPEKFDPDRFSATSRKTIPSFGFEPFGSGKRKCLGFRFSLVEASICLAGILRKFEVNLVPCQNVVPVHGIVTTPAEEIWVMFKNRK